MSEEAELLREMVADRDRRIILVRQKTSDLDDKQQRLLDELDAATEQSARQQITHQTEKTRLLQISQTAHDQWHAMEVDLQKQGTSLAAYANLVSQTTSGSSVDGIQSVTTPTDVDANHVMRMQAQLCKAMHSMGILDHQLQLTQEMCEARIKLQREVLAGQRESKAQLELQLLNDLIKADTERKQEESMQKKEFQSLQRQVKQLKRQIAGNEEEDEQDATEKEGTENNENSENQEDDEDDDDDEEDDPETVKAKEDLQNLLEQRREQVKALEKQLDEQEAELTQLRETHGDQAVGDVAPEERPPPPKNAPPPPPASDDEDEDDDDDAAADNNKPDEMAARLAQVMENVKLEEVERMESVSEIDLLKMAQNRLTAGAASASDDDDDEEESSDEEEDSDDEEEEEDSGDEDEQEERTATPTAAAVDDNDDDGDNDDAAASPAAATPAAAEEEEKKTADDDDSGDEEESSKRDDDNDNKQPLTTTTTENGGVHENGDATTTAATAAATTADDEEP